MFKWVSVNFDAPFVGKRLRRSHVIKMSMTENYCVGRPVEMFLEISEGVDQTPARKEGEDLNKEFGDDENQEEPAA
jgi:hypothetical protein